MAENLLKEVSETEKCFDRVSKIILSCTNQEHLFTSGRLIDLFERKYYDEGLSFRLRNLRHKKFLELKNLIN
jgi:hypothetical protein